MSIHISRAEPAHLLSIGLCATRQSAFRFISLHNEPDTLSRLCETAWSLSDEGTVFGVIGYLLVRPGHAVCWAMFEPHVTEVSALGLTRVVRRGIQDEMKRIGITRLESAVDVSDSAAVRWARFLGFEIEGLMRKSSSVNTDQWLIARITK